MNDLTSLARAVVYRERMDGVGPGEGQAALRRDLLASEPVVTDAVRALADRLLAVRVADMPPEIDDVSLLVDTLAFKIGATARADAWRHVGINTHRGRGLLGRNSASLDWPIWFTLRTAALG